MSDQKFATVALDRIAVEDGHNPRESFDENALARLAESLKDDGVLQPLIVRPGKSGDYVLVDGERRFRAAQLAELAEVPVVIRENGSPATEAATVHFLQEGFNPIEDARALRSLAIERKLRRHRDIAQRAKMSTSWVSERLRLLELPGGVQGYIASGAAPVAAERSLRKIATASVRAAECACELVAPGEVEPAELVDEPGAVVSRVAAGVFDPPAGVVSVSQGAEIAELVTDAAVGEELVRRVLDARAGTYRAESSYLRFDERDLDQARAAGALLELDSASDWYSFRFLTDKAVGQEIATQIVEREEREAAKRRRAEEKARAESAEGSEAAEGTGESESPEERRRKERDDAKREREAKRTYNLNLGAALLDRKTAKGRKEYALARAKAVARLVLADNDGLPAAGLRYCMTQLQEVEVKTLKSGETREKVTHADRGRCLEYVGEQIERARTANEVLEILADCLIAGLKADQEEVAHSKQVNCWLGAAEEIRKELAAEITEVRPRRPRRRS